MSEAQAITLTPEQMHETAARLNMACKPLHEIIEAILDSEDAIDPETGEVTVELGAVIDALNLALTHKVDVYAAINDRLRSEADALKEFAARYTKKASARENAAKRLRERMQSELARLGQDKAKGKLHSATIQTNSASSVVLDVIDDALVPDEYAITTREIDVKKIGEALKAGTKLTFAHLERGTHLRFR